MKVKVSILIPIYMAERHISECIQSVFEQTYDNIEYIIVNDASPDHSIEIVNQISNKYPHRKQFVKIINNTKNFGIAQTRNILIENATGNYIYFVDSDDYIEKNAIEVFVNTAVKENADIVRCNYYNLKEGKSNPVIRKFDKTEDFVANSISYDYDMKSLWVLFVRRTLFTENRLSFPNHINGCEDFLMTVKLFYYANIIVDIPNLLYHYRQYEGTSLTKQKNSFYSDTCNAVSEIILFLKDKHLFEKHKDLCLRLMFTAKQHYLINKSIRDINKYINTFPESNSCYKLYKYNKKQTILFFLAEHKLTILIKLIYFVM